MVYNSNSVNLTSSKWRTIDSESVVTEIIRKYLPYDDDGLHLDELGIDGTDNFNREI